MPWSPERAASLRPGRPRPRTMGACCRLISETRPKSQSSKSGHSTPAGDGSGTGDTSSSNSERHRGQVGLRSSQGRMQLPWKTERQPFFLQGSARPSASTVWQQMLHSCSPARALGSSLRDEKAASSTCHCFGGPPWPPPPSPPRLLSPRLSLVPGRVRKEGGPSSTKSGSGASTIRSELGMGKPLELLPEGVWAVAGGEANWSRSPEARAASKISSCSAFRPLKSGRSSPEPPSKSFPLSTASRFRSCCRRMAPTPGISSTMSASTAAAAPPRRTPEPGRDRGAGSNVDVERARCASGLLWEPLCTAGPAAPDAEVRASLDGGAPAWLLCRRPVALVCSSAGGSISCSSSSLRRRPTSGSDTKAGLRGR
mmetsp:Transcript_92260/g.223921  ORF Transcript_92260/g.223921 Transcript_92260/m.223921 type:complete len:370 (+) Transcript_92260:195-1304(+)